MRRRKNLIATLAIVFIALVLFYFLFFIVFRQPPVREKEFHAHADFAVFIRGQKIDFSQKQFAFKESCGKPGEAKKAIDLSTLEGMKEAVHLHDSNGNVLHLHSANATLPMFFKSIGFDLTPTCLQTPTALYCNTQTETLKVFVNDVQEENFVKYSPKDLDRILVSFGSESPALVRMQYDLVSNQSCVYSRKCPARAGFETTPEECV